MFSLDNLPDVAKNKSEELKQVFIKAANSSLSKGRTEEEAEFAGIAAIKAFSRASGSLPKRALEHRKVSKPSHVPSKEQIALLREQEAIEKAKELEDKKIILESLFAKANLPQGIDRNIIAANFDRHDRLVIVFDTGERITTNPIDIKSYVENYVSITGSGSDGSITYTNENPTEIEVGGIPIGTTFDNVSFSDFVNQLLYPELFPSLTNPNLSFSSSLSGLVEIGLEVDLTFNSVFSRGSISPQYDSDEPFRSGLPNQYTYSGVGLVDKSTAALSDSQIVSDYTVVKGIQSWTSRVSYDAGVQPKGSNGSDYNTPLPSGNTPNRTVSIRGVYPYFATTVDMFTLTKQPLSQFGATITIVFAKETGDGNKQTIDFPKDDWGAITKIEQYNSFTSSYEDVPLSLFTVSELDKTINGITVTYRRYTHNSVTVGSRLMRWTA